MSALLPTYIVAKNYGLSRGPMLDVGAFGDAVSRKMEKLGLTYRQVEKLTGVDKSAIHRICNGSSLSAENLVRLSHFINNT